MQAEQQEAKHLFVDDLDLARQVNTARRVHGAAKLDRPVLEADLPWEQGGIYGGVRDRRVYVYGTVQRDSPDGAFRLWYGGLNGAIYYAESRDGIAWRRPELGLVDYQGSRRNNLLPLNLHSPSIIRDEREPDPAKRYKAIGSRGGVSAAERLALETRFGPGLAFSNRAYCAAHSPDGLDWRLDPGNPVLPGMDTITLAQDPATGEYLAFHKRHNDPRTLPVKRQIYLSVSRDMQNWLAPELVLLPDECDHAAARTLNGGTHAEFYNLSAFPCAGQWLGLVTVFRRTGVPPVKGPEQSQDDGPIDVQLVHSRDGRKWQRCSDRTPAIPLGPSAYDAGGILGLCNAPVVVGDEMWMYYTAMTTTHGGFLPKKQLAIARAVWRRDGLVALHIGPGGGLVETATVRQPAGDGWCLKVNAKVREGALTVELLGGNGEPLAGFGRGDCQAVHGDSVRHAIAWKTHRHLPAATPFRLRFHVGDADLFSYAMERRSDQGVIGVGPQNSR